MYHVTSSRRIGRPSAPAVRRHRSAHPVLSRTAPVFSEREKNVLELMADGLTKTAIADRMGVSPHTVDYHVRSVYDKLGAQSGAQAVARAIWGGLI